MASVFLFEFKWAVCGCFFNLEKGYQGIALNQIMIVLEACVTDLFTGSFIFPA